MKKLIILTILILSHIVLKAQTTPLPPTNVTSQLNNGIILVVWSFPTYPDNITGFEVTPIYIQGNMERRLTNRTKFSTNISEVFDEQQLRNDAILLGAGNGPIKYKFTVRTVNGLLYSSESKTKQALNLK